MTTLIVVPAASLTGRPTRNAQAQSSEARQHTHNTLQPSPALIRQVVRTCRFEVDGVAVSARPLATTHFTRLGVARVAQGIRVFPSRRTFQKIHAIKIHAIKQVKSATQRPVVVRTTLGVSQGTLCAALFRSRKFWMLPSTGAVTLTFFGDALVGV